jgi:hypothetical protein
MIGAILLWSVYIAILYFMWDRYTRSPKNKRRQWLIFSIALAIILFLLGLYIHVNWLNAPDSTVQNPDFGEPLLVPDPFEDYVNKISEYAEMSRAGELDTEAPNNLEGLDVDKMSQLLNTDQDTKSAFFTLKTTAPVVLDDIHPKLYSLDPWKHVPGGKYPGSGIDDPGNIRLREMRVYNSRINPSTEANAIADARSRLLPRRIRA